MSRGMVLGSTNRIFLTICIIMIFGLYSALAEPMADSGKPESSLLVFSGEASPPEESLALWYRQPAERWLEALPVGNGRLGAMVFGGVQEERVALNESTFWSGKPGDGSENPPGSEHLDKIRKLFFENKYKEAVGLVEKHLLGRPKSYGTHLPFGDLRIKTHQESGNVKNYRRTLDLDQAVVRVEYEIDGVCYTREVFVSHVDNTITIRFSASEPGKIDLNVAFVGASKTIQARAEVPASLIMSGDAREKRHSDGTCGVSGYGIVRASAENGKVEIVQNSLEVKGADSATLLIAINTDFRGVKPKEKSEKQIGLALKKVYDRMLTDHVADHQKYFRRVSLDLGTSAAVALPTDVRRKRIAQGEDDPQMSALYFQYGRYLMIAGSREDSPLLMNLQGIWNDNRACNMPWTCDFHLDINTQQIYWPAEVTNLSECHAPLLRFIESLREPGRLTAKTTYGASGWVCHVVTNAWGYTAPGWGLRWGMHPVGGVWISSHLWEHYQFTRDTQFLKDHAYPTLKEAAIFFLDYMVINPNTGYLVTGPSISPENGFIAPDGLEYGESMGTVHDILLVRDLFSQCIEGSQVLGIDKPFRAKLEKALAKLPPLKIGKHGQLQEWLEDYPESVPNHRHTSHLAALFPSDQITPRTTPDLARAAQVSIKRRLEQPDWEDVEWSRANMICYEARLLNGEKAYSNLMGLIGELSDESLLTFSGAGIASAQYNIFSIDGNFAGAAGIAEMLLQSHGDELSLLPALPKNWPDGSFKGLRARGNFEVDASWKDGAVTNLTIRSLGGNRLRIRAGEHVWESATTPGASYRLDGDLKIMLQP